jgi:hypothetical protein
MNPQQQAKIAEQVITNLRGLGVDANLETKFKIVDGDLYQENTVKVKDEGGTTRTVNKVTQPVQEKPEELKAKLEEQKAKITEDKVRMEAELDNYITEVSKAIPKK